MRTALMALVVALTVGGEALAQVPYWSYRPTYNQIKRAEAARRVEGRRQQAERLQQQQARALWEANHPVEAAVQRQMNRYQADMDWQVNRLERTIRSQQQSSDITPGFDSITITPKATGGYYIRRSRF